MKIPYAGKEGLDHQFSPPVAKPQRQVHRIGEGTTVGNKRQIAVRFNPELFRRISSVARENNLSFAVQVSSLCEIALAAQKNGKA